MLKNIYNKLKKFFGNKKWWIIFIILFISFFNLNYIEIVNSEPLPKPYLTIEQPNNTLGSTYKIVNWSYFKQLFTQHTDWNLQYKRYMLDSWTNGNQYLGIQKTWNYSGYWKINLILDIPIDVYGVRFTFEVDLPVLNYVSESNYRVNINYTIPNTNEIYNIFYDYSDLMQIRGLQFTKGINNNNMFYMIFEKYSVNSGHYEFDPTFGTSGSGTSTNSYFDDAVMGTYVTMGSETGYILDNYTMWYKAPTGNFKGCCMLYWMNNLTLVPNSQSDEVSFPDNNDNIVSIKLPVTNGCILTPNKKYILGVWADLVSGSGHIYLNSLSASGNKINYDIESYNYASPPSPYANTSYLVSSSYGCLIYYSEHLPPFENTCPIATNPTITNHSTNINISVGFFNITVTDIDGNTSSGNITCSNSDTDYWINQANGTKSLTLSTLNYSTNYTLWVNISNDCSLNYWYWFITELEPSCPTCNETYSFYIYKYIGHDNLDWINLSGNITVNCTSNYFNIDDFKYSYYLPSQSAYQDDGQNFSLGNGSWFSIWVETWFNDTNPDSYQMTIHNLGYFINCSVNETIDENEFITPIILTISISGIGLLMIRRRKRNG